MPGPRSYHRLRTRNIRRVVNRIALPVAAVAPDRARRAALAPLSNRAVQRALEAGVVPPSLVMTYSRALESSRRARSKSNSSEWGNPKRASR
jgi:hypothetical protein